VSGRRSQTGSQVGGQGVIYPLIFHPILQPRIWGGRSLERLFGRQIPEGEKIGEFWEVSDLPDGVSRVAVGPMAGRTLNEVVADWGRRLTGDAPLVDHRFPLLIKLLDACEALSVQVHPDEEACRIIGGSARVKHEAWYIVEARQDAAIYAGFRPGITRERFVEAAADGRVADTLEKIPVRTGDVFYVPSGTVHALGAGIVVAEVQTPSDTTYRVFDWNRVDRSGRPRDLHMEEALKSMRYVALPEAQKPVHHADAWSTRTRLVTCPRFAIDRVRVVEGFEGRLGEGMMSIWIVLAGRGRLTTRGLPEPILFSAGESVVIPAEPDETVLSVGEDCLWLQVTIPV